MRLNIGSECHLVGEEVAQGGASTSFSPLCSEGGLQIQIKAHTNTVHRNYQLTQIHVHTDHTNTQKQEVLEGKLHKVVHQPASQLLSTSVQRNCQITQMQIQSSHKYTHYWFTLLMTLLFSLTIFLHCVSPIIFLRKAGEGWCCIACTDCTRSSLHFVICARLKSPQWILWPERSWSKKSRFFWWGGGGGGMGGEYKNGFWLPMHPQPPSSQYPHYHRQCWNTLANMRTSKNTFQI